MPKVSIRELKAHLSEIIARVERGETILVSKRNAPVVELRPLSLQASIPRLGNPVAGVHLPESFWAPLAEEELAAWGGEAALYSGAPK